MSEKQQMGVAVYLARPGLEEEIRETGFLLDALIDTGADISVVSPTIAERVYGERPVPYSPVTVQDFTGRLSTLKTVPLAIALESTDGQLVSAQVDCLQGDVDGLLVGADVLSLLGLSITFDYKRNQVSIERYTWESFEDEVASIYRALSHSETERQSGRFSD